jgi:hypothetical protein
MKLSRPYFSPDDPPGDGDGTGSSNTATPVAVKKDPSTAGVDYKTKYEELQADVRANYYSKDRYDGLQQKLQKEVEAHGTTKLALGETQTTIAGLTRQVEESTTKFGEYDSKISENEIELESLRTKTRRATLIFKDFPELAPFEADGLLPETGSADNDDALRTLFGNFSGKIGALQKKAKDDFGAGGGVTPPDAETNTLLSAEAHRKLANEAMMKGDRKTYDEHYDKYLELSKPVK